MVGFGLILQDPAEPITDEERAGLIDMVVTHGADLTRIISDLLVAARVELISAGRALRRLFARRSAGG